MQIKVKGMMSTSTEVAHKMVRGWDVWLNINTSSRGKVTFEVAAADWKFKHPKAFKKGYHTFDNIEEAVECYNNYK